MTHLTVRAWVMMLLENRTEWILYEYDFPSMTACCSGTEIDSELSNAVTSGQVKIELPTCPECSMIRESLILAMENNVKA